MADNLEGGLSAENGADVISGMEDLNLAAVEISGGLCADNVKKGIESEDCEGYFRPLVEKTRKSTNLPLICVCPSP